MESTKMISLSGKWKIIKEGENYGKTEGWANSIPDIEIFNMNIPEYLPISKWPMNFSYSNIFPKYQGYVWYYNEFDSYLKACKDERILITFERAAYVCYVYLNGEFIGEHRHQDKTFSFDVTDKIKDGKNLLAVRCFEPRTLGETIDGIRIQDLPNSCFAQTGAFAFGADESSYCLESLGGILGFVHLQIVPKVSVEEIYVRSFWKSGDITIKVGITNAGKTPVSKEINVVIADKKSGSAVSVISENFEIPVGYSEVELCSKVHNHKLWELDSPALYTATVTIEGTGHTTTQFGFKDFRIKNGFFFLNGKRIFLKGAHCSISASNAIHLKALGFNMIRTIARAFNEETLKICDEIGLLVIDAAATAWGMFLHENTCTQIEEYNIDMIKASRNHPSVAMYCIFNETWYYNPEILQYGAESLPKLRKYAPDTLFLYHSGRWDNEITRGSASNPGSDKWDTFLGAEGIIDYPNREVPKQIFGFLDGAMGDIHVYPEVPVTSENRNYLRKYGNGVNPVFISESGIASQTDPMSNYLSHCNQNLCEAVTTEHIKLLYDHAEEFLDYFDLRDVYPLLFDFVRDTEKLNGAQRSLLYNLYRSNPMINGFSFTSFGFSNEGHLQGENVIKDSLAYAIQQGNAPLRWSLFSNERTVYAKKPFEIEAVLCNEDVLPPGKYSAQAHIRGKDGCVWKKAFEIDYPAEGHGGMPPLAYSVLREQVILSPGEYTFSARLLSGGVAYDGDLKITVIEPQIDKQAEITVCGMPENVIDFLNTKGIKTKELCKADLSNIPQMVLVGNPDISEYEYTLHELASLGTNIVFIDVKFFEKNEDILKKIAGESANVRYTVSTIYHNDNINITHPIFNNIKDAGALEFEKFGIVYPEYIFNSVNKPSKTICASIRIDASYTIPGLTIGEYAIGKGKFILNSFNINPSVNKHPYADQLLLNFVNFYGL